MLKYCQIMDEETGLVNIAIGTNAAYYESIGMAERDVEQSDVDNNWYLTEKCPHKSEEEKQQEEAERISHLKCTKRVLVLILEQLGIDYFEQIEPLINANRQAKLEWELCVELERSNPLLNVIGAELSITPEQIDQVFKYANGEVDTLSQED